MKYWLSILFTNPDRSICAATVVMSQTGIVYISRFSSETLLRQSQLASFPAVLGKLFRNESLSSKDKLLPLMPFIDGRQFIRSSGHLQYAPLPAATRMPIVLDAQNAITRLLMVHFHEICHHAGPQYVKSFLQQRYFIFGVGAALRTISYRCFQCRRFRVENVEPLMAPSPRCRFSSTDSPYPFANSGVDAFGLFFIVNGNEQPDLHLTRHPCLSFGTLSRLDHGLLHPRLPTLQ